MARTLRNETAAHIGMASYLVAQQQTREDWRRVLARRDDKRAAVRNARRGKHAGNALVSTVFAVALGLAGAASLFFSLAA